MKPLLNADGTIDVSLNPNLHILFDFGYTFQYPIELAFNNNVIVTVQDFSDLMTITTSTTPNLFINSISFPFSVKYLDVQSKKIELLSIQNETAFAQFLDTINFGSQNTCNCDQTYVPICVEIENEIGTFFIESFLNSCEAQCEGFSENDALQNCSYSYHPSVIDTCFEFNFPVTLSNSNNEIITVDSEEALHLTLYTEYEYEFSFPLTVTQLETSTEIIIHTSEDFGSLLSSCINNNITTPITDCITFNYPIQLVAPQQATIEVNTDEELNNALDDSNIFYDFVYPFEIIENQLIVTVNSETELNTILADCN
ncbi:hypothetical protein [uncultured Kordia sp.]|uniref:hypothetical protein n=1 Tax=uncultured Kordia sp. TaxID=507699 RepID=UPI00263682E6|nr:hypothetical protein [uncultured Kordia sp.]